MNPQESNDCPITCPNRKRDSRAGKIASYLFALAVSGFLAFSCVSFDRRGESVPVVIWMPCLVLIGTALGVNIDSATIGSMFKSRG